MEIRGNELTYWVSAIRGHIRHRGYEPLELDKNAFMEFVEDYVHFNPDTRLGKYYHNISETSIDRMVKAFVRWQKENN